MQVVEKLASSEIAQSREKSEVLFTRYTGPAIDPVAYDFDDSQREKIFAFTDWCMEAAERDTRERIAHPKMMWGWEIEEIKSAMRQFQSKHPGKLPSEIERAERIRGKE